MASRDHSRTRIHEQLEKLQRQNEILKNQLELRRQNADLKTANILAQILGWIEKLNSSEDVRVDDGSAEKVAERPSNTSAKIADPFSPSPRRARSRSPSPHRNQNCSGPKPTRCDGETSRGPMKQKELSTSSRHSRSKSPPKGHTTYSDGCPVLRNIGLSSFHDESLLGKEHSSANIGSENEMPVTPRLIGEIAFQLDRRLLSYIFNGHSHTGSARRRFYGFTIQNIPDMINVECASDEQARMAMSYRYQYIFNRMKMLGYDINYHPMFSIRMVNQFGLLNVSGQGMGQSLQLQDPDILTSILVNIAPKEDLKDILILLDCLVFLAHDEGRPLFIY